jgi:lipid-A-disaccharide synthase
MRILISCGEPSGDLYAGALASALGHRHPGVEIAGLGGERLEAAGGRLVGHYRGLSVTGLTEAVRFVPRSVAMLRRLLHSAREQRPDVAVPIDFPDFNFRLMAALHGEGIPVAYYVSPQLWAWRPRRMRTMKRHAGRVLVIFPFEEEVYRRADVPVQFVGHPLVDLIPAAAEPAEKAARRQALGLAAGAPTLALLPGSRRSELAHIAPTLAAALPMLRAKVPDLQVVVAAAPHLGDDLFAPLLAPTGARPVLVRERTDAVLAAADVVVTASGTATVQAALHRVPMVVVYRLSPVTYALGRPFVMVDTYAMPNLLAGRRIVPELIQDGFTAERVVEETAPLLTDDARRAEMRAELGRVRDVLGAPGASARAAEAVLEVARHGR